MLRTWITWLAIVGLLATFGCAGVQERETVATERTLSAAGFDMKLADSPQKLEQLQTLPQHQILTRQTDGKVYFMYADAEDCKCLYVGDEKAYQEFSKMTEQEQLAQARAEAAEEWDAAAWGPWYGAWGPWAPYW